MATPEESVGVEVELYDEVSKSVEKMSKNVVHALHNIDKSLKSTNNEAEKTSESTFGLVTALKTLGAAYGVKKALDFAGALIDIRSEAENLEAQFKPLLGSVSEAKKRMEELAKFTARTPYKLPEVSKTSKLLQALTKGALASGDGLRLVGDAAAVAGEPIQELAVHIGRAYDALRSNRAAGESLSRLQEVGLLSGDARTKIEELQKQSEGIQAWNVLQKELEKTSGGMDDLSKTADGMESTLSDLLDQVAKNVLDSTGAWELYKEAVEAGVRAGEGLVELTTNQKELNSEFQIYIDNIDSEVSAIENINQAKEISRKLEKEINSFITGRNDLLLLELSGAGTKAQQLQTRLQDEEKLISLLKEQLKTTRDYINEGNKGLEEQQKQYELYIKERERQIVEAEKARVEIEKQSAQSRLDLERQNAIDIQSIRRTSIEEETKAYFDGLDSFFNIEKEKQRIRDENTLAFLSGEEAAIAALEMKRREEIEKIRSEYEEKVIIEEEYQEAIALINETYAKRKEKVSDAYTKKVNENAEKRRKVEMESIMTVATAATGALRELFSKNKAFAYIDIIMNTARGITRALADLPYPLNVAQSIAVGVSGAVQAAKVKSAKMYRGGQAKGRNTLTTLNDGVGHEPEFVMRSEAVRRIGVDNLEKMNSGTGAGSAGGVFNFNITQREGEDSVLFAERVANAIALINRNGIEASMVF